MALLGELETAVMEALWTTDSALRVRDVHEFLTRDRELAYTTVMTVLDRLAKKGVVTRTQADGERAWLYRPTQARVEFYADAVRQLLAEAGDDAPAVLELLPD